MNYNKKPGKKKRVKNVDTGEIFESVKAAAEKNFITDTSIAKCCRGEKKSAAGYKWEYVEE